MSNTVKNRPRTQKVSTATESNTLDNLQITYEKNKKAVNTGVTIVLLAIIGVFGYLKLYQAPRENKAAYAISYAQTYFQQDSLNKALNGDGQHAGFLRIIKKYSGTDAANLANYYAGICYLQMHNPQSAIKHLKDFKPHGTNVAYAAYGAMGDAYMEMNKVKEGIEYYNKAAENKKDMLLTPIYLFRAALAYEMNNQADKAKENYKRIRDEFPQSLQARDVDKNLARLGVLD